MKNILIVEDELLIAEDIKLTVEELRYKTVAITTRASAAIEVLESKKID